MEQSSINILKGIATGCFLAVVVMSLATKARAGEIVKSPVEELQQGEAHSLIPTIYFGSRGTHNKERDIWGVGIEEPLTPSSMREYSA